MYLSCFCCGFGVFLQKDQKVGAMAAYMASPTFEGIICKYIKERDVDK